MADKIFRAAWLNRTAQFLYFVKCIYLLISAWQIRNGYPTLCAGNLITHAYGLANMIFFKMLAFHIFMTQTRIGALFANLATMIFSSNDYKYL